jgi:16S rRNA (guanine966-N2)-methyltransferase
MAGDNRLRIIGGRWRSRRLHFPDVPGLRPTPDRVRETLFNWLTPLLPGARCLDLFAGSGALGLEALSRGAAEVLFVEHHDSIARQLEANLKMLDNRGGRVVQTDAERWLQDASQEIASGFDIVFLDPPFGQNRLPTLCSQLHQHGWLARDARIYLEAERDAKLCLPAHWQLLREKFAGRIAYRLYRAANDDFRDEIAHNAALKS